MDLEKKSSEEFECRSSQRNLTAPKMPHSGSTIWEVSAASSMTAKVQSLTPRLLFGKQEIGNGTKWIKFQ